MIEKGDILLSDDSKEFTTTKDYETVISLKDKFVIERRDLVEKLNEIVMEFQNKWNAKVFIEVGKSVLVKPVEIPRILLYYSKLK